MAGFGKNSGPSLPPKSLTFFGNVSTSQSPSLIPNKSWVTPASRFENLQVLKQTQSPNLNLEGSQSATEVSLSSPLLEAQSSDASPITLVDANHSSLNLPTSTSLSNSDYLQSDRSLSPSRPLNYQASKRTKSSPPETSTKDSLPASYFEESDSEREARAKAKRLARFCAELNQPIEGLQDSRWRRSTDTSHTLSEVDNKKVSGNESSNVFGDGPDASIVGLESKESSASIVGICEDMCPESEREERERKGDLDQYERLDGERNQTSKLLAVKKYTRTAEREAFLIRPMPVLQKTMDYLLDLLDQPYNKKFLGMYNFLWDRMRAIRMDLRMQHIFDRHAITMLEQMIRFHIIAMHELCEYNKGEGFSEGFDAHLNIEQMNKTSVELFQIYDDHRKKGISVLTEKEFRGYYALLKLDKHPGYIVEPAELSLDLAKMTPEIRGSQEVVFARNVARACRTGNFVTFFRLARVATYLQACLMHAHFGKLRTQALASLHSAIQNNQGIPISHVVQWLGLEGEDVEKLLEYHGFATKAFEEPYMVKENIFLNTDTHYPTKCSKLVQLKKSGNISNDVSSAPLISVSSRKLENPLDLKEKLVPRAPEVSFASDIQKKKSDRTTEMPLSNYADRLTDKKIMPPFPVLKRKPFTKKNGTPKTDVTRGIDEEMHVSEGNSFQNIRKHECVVTSTLAQYNDNEIKGHFKVLSPVPWQNISINYPASTDSYTVASDLLMPSIDLKGQVETPVKSSEDLVQIQKLQRETDYMEKTIELVKEVGHTKDSQELLTARKEHEATVEKLKMILRKWKAQASKKREIREQRLSLANLALGSVQIGPPLRQRGTNSIPAVGTLDIDSILKERSSQSKKSLSRLNISNVVGQTLVARNHNPKCLCWKLILCINRSDTLDKMDNLASTWLAMKLIGSRMKVDDELVLSSTNLSIWKNSRIDAYQRDFFCLSVVREVTFQGNTGDSLQDVIDGTNGIVYLIAESVPWENQRIQLHNILMTVPNGSKLPLLVLSRAAHNEATLDSEIFSTLCRLGLQNVDKSRISCVSVVFLSPDKAVELFSSFFSDDNLRKGLHWLADQSPLQPHLHLVNTRELVMNYLYSSLEFVNSMKNSNTDPNSCISIFNEALNQSTRQVWNAASSNPNQWPCPEIDLLDKHSIEKRMLDRFLPERGWSSEDRIQPIVAALSSCTLPSFSDVSWLHRGSYLGEGIQDQKSRLEKQLIQYLSESTKIISGDLAEKECVLLLQRGAVLEVQNSDYRIVPKWLEIFRRIFNWRLMKLASKEFAAVYVLDRDELLTDGYPRGLLTTPLKYNLRSSISEFTLPGSGSYMQSQYYQAKHSVCLDEMVEIGCYFPEDPELKSSPKQVAVVDVIPNQFAGHSGINENGLSSETKHALTSIDGLSNETEHALTSSEQGNESNTTNEGRDSYKLRLLLDRCNKLQNVIEQKLSVFF